MEKKIEARIEHLKMIQTNISRMASNSFIVKGWSVTSIGAIYAFWLTSKNNYLLWLILGVTILFWFHDAYYLIRGKEIEMAENDNIKQVNLGRAYLFKKYGIPLMEEVGFEYSIIEFTRAIVDTIEELEDRIRKISSKNIDYNPKDYILKYSEFNDFLSREGNVLRNDYQSPYTVIEAIVRRALEKNKYDEVDIRRLFENIVSQCNRYLGNNFETLTNEIDGRYLENNFPYWLALLEKKYPLRTDMPKIFLSYAYTDQLFTISLFKYFYDNNIYLYVDWMHNGKLKTNSLKDKLISELETSNQILFLRTLSSELKLRGGNHQIRQWCAWEIGCFDYINQYRNNRFFINYYIDSVFPQSDLIDGFKVMTKIRPNVGIE